MEKETVVNLLSSSTAGIIGRIFCHPIDTVKARIQSSDFLDRSSFRTIVSRTLKSEGIIGFYKGFGAVAIGGIPGTCIYLMSYEWSKKKLSEFERVSPFVTYLASGMIAEALCCIWFVPIDVVKERLQVQKAPLFHASFDRNVYNNSVDAVKKIVKYEGIGGIYKGYFVTLLSFGPFSACYFLFYEMLKNSRWGMPNGDNDISFRSSLVMSAIAGSGASFLTSPLDMVKLRLQIERSPLHKASGGLSQPSKSSILDIFSEAWKSHGLRGIFRGALARVFFHAPNTAITMAAYEESKKYWSASM